MIADLVLSLQNGYENRGLIMPHLYKYNYYDCCIKVGNDIVPQKAFINNQIKNFNIIPVIIVKCVPCLIGVNSIIDVDIYKEELNFIKPFIDIHQFIYMTSNACIKYRGITYFLNDLDPSRILNILGFMPNLIDYDDFIRKHKHPFIDCAGGYFYISGAPFNHFRELEITQSNQALTVLNPRIIGNIIGVLNLFEVFKSYEGSNNEILYKYFNDRYKKSEQILYHDFLLSYRWLNLDKVNVAIKRNGINIICCYGINLIEDLDEFSLIMNDNETKINDVKNSINEIKNTIIDYFKFNSQITEILFF